MSKCDPPARPIRRDPSEVTRDDREVIEQVMFGSDRLIVSVAERDAALNRTDAGRDA